MVSPSRASDQRMTTRTRRYKTDVTTYKLVKADKPDLRQIRDFEDNLWFMEEQCHSVYSRSGRHHRPVDNNGTTASQESQETAREKSRHTMSRQENLQQHAAWARDSSTVNMKRVQGEHNSTFVDTAFEARSCTTPRDAKWAQWANYTTTETESKRQADRYSNRNCGMKNADTKRTKSHAMPKETKSRNDANSRESTVPQVVNDSLSLEAVAGASHDRIRRDSTSLSNTTMSYSQPRKVSIEYGSDADSRGSTTPRAVKHSLPTVNPLGQLHVPGASTHSKVMDERLTSEIPLRVERPLARNNATKRTARQRPPEATLRYVMDSTRNENATRNKNSDHVHRNESPIPDIDDLRTIPSESERNELLSHLGDCPSPYVDVTSRHSGRNCNKPLPDLPKEDGGSRIFLTGKTLANESTKISDVLNYYSQIGSRFVETGLMSE
ncbi:hypothetical protein E4T56_gene1825 [Termitomyces sp. T112]|nr:hypothetical protein E4T56_gene1825 [Termitomyces sp. T112]